MTKQQKYSQHALHAKREAEDDGDREAGHPVVYVPGPSVLRRYNVTGMTLWRWRQDHRLNFPAPIVIQNRNYWLESDLVAWERSRPNQLPQDHPATARAGEG